MPRASRGRIKIPRNFNFASPLLLDDARRRRSAAGTVPRFAGRQAPGPTQPKLPTVLSTNEGQGPVSGTRCRRATNAERRSCTRRRNVGASSELGNAWATQRPATASSARPSKPRKLAVLSGYATSCKQPHAPGRHGKEGVVGSSPTPGSQESPANAGLSLCRD